jgi:hypothetical protein
MPKIENTGTWKLNIITYASQKFLNIRFIQEFLLSRKQKAKLTESKKCQEKHNGSSSDQCHSPAWTPTCSLNDQKDQVLNQMQ